jgi:hypothetical protein
MLLKLLLRCWFPPLLLLLVVVPLFITGGQALAQDTGSQTTDRVPATIVLVDRLDDAPEGAVILRRHDQHPYDVVMIARREATAELLSAAVFTLLVTRSVLGDVPEAEARIAVLRVSGPQAWRSRIVPRLGRLLGKLRSAEPGPVKGVGVVRSLTVWLPADYELRLTPAGGAGAALGTR